MHEDILYMHELAMPENQLFSDTNLVAQKMKHSHGVPLKLSSLRLNRHVKSLELEFWESLEVLVT